MPLVFSSMQSGANYLKRDKRKPLNGKRLRSRSPLNLFYSWQIESNLEVIRINGSDAQHHRQGDRQSEPGASFCTQIFITLIYFSRWASDILQPSTPNIGGENGKSI